MDALLDMSHLDDLFADVPARLNVAQTAELLGVSDTTVYKWLSEGVLPGYRVGGAWVLLREEVKDSIASGRNTPPLPLPPSEQAEETPQ